MPFSAPEGKWLTLNLLSRLDRHFQFQQVLDVGAGAGGYSQLLRDRLSPKIWTALEIWEPYLERFKLAELYNRLIVADVRNWAPDQDYDLVLMGDVLEHMQKAEAQECVIKLLQHTQLLLISIPIIEMPQDEVDGNPYEKHVKEDWSHDEVLASFSNISLAFIGESLGVYLLSSNQGVHEVVQFLIADLPSEFFRI